MYLLIVWSYFESRVWIFLGALPHVIFLFTSSILSVYAIYMCLDRRAGEEMGQSRLM